MIVLLMLKMPKETFYLLTTLYQRMLGSLLGERWVRSISGEANNVVSVCLKKKRLILKPTLGLP